MPSESIHVPAHAVRRITGVAKLLVPVVLTAAVTSLTTTWGWIKTRTSVQEIEPLLVEVRLIAKAAQSDSFANHNELVSLQKLSIELAETSVELHAQAEVDRAYNKSPRRAEYIERARRFYLRELKRLLEIHPHDPAEAVRLTRLAVWRPDRDD